jgi:integrase
VALAIETGMRRGELLGLLWDNVDLERRTAFLPVTKNGESRGVPLSSRAVEVLRALPPSTNGLRCALSLRVHGFQRIDERALD